MEVNVDDEIMGFWFWVFGNFLGFFSWEIFVY
jgi:hypothetical protein